MEPLQPLGPEALRQRIEQIRARIGQPNLDKSSGFGSLVGHLGGDNAPLNPFGQGMSIGKETPAELKGKILQAAQANGVEPALLDALVQAESSYNPTAVSKAGAKGLTQLMPDTALGLGVTNPYDPDQSLNGGAKYLSSLLKQFPNMEHAVAAYNAGPGAVIRAGGIPNYPETRAYVQRVMELYREKRG